MSPNDNLPTSIIVTNEETSTGTNTFQKLEAKLSLMNSHKLKVIQTAIGGFLRTLYEKLNNSTTTLYTIQNNQIYIYRTEYIHKHKIPPASSNTAQSIKSLQIMRDYACV